MKVLAPSLFLATTLFVSFSALGGSSSPNKSLYSAASSFFGPTDMDFGLYDDALNY